MNSKVPISIVIPVFNRADIIAETLDSISAQTYKEWECLLVDDGSTDDSLHVINNYCQKDARFRIFQRPDNRRKGANACRNIGLENAHGEFIIFFDSDDLMTPDHIAVKLDAITGSPYDYVITKTKYFNAEIDLDSKYYNFETTDITAYNYITQKINWLTYDVCIRAPLAKSIQFNELLQSGQEYNYFCKLVLVSTNATFVKKVLTLRRHHQDSIRGNLIGNKQKLKQASFLLHWYTYIDTELQSPLIIKQYLLNACMFLLVKNPNFIYSNSKLNRRILSVFGFNGARFLIRMFVLRARSRYQAFKNNLC